MASTSTGQLSRGRISRLAGVQPQAVNNWERRHADFPRPERVDGTDVFMIAEVTAWLDRRVVPRSLLKEGETLGTTLGDRFRANLRSSAHLGGTAGPADGLPETRPPVRRQADTTSLNSRELEMFSRRALDALREVADVGASGYLILSMLYLRQRDTNGWSELVSAVPGPEDHSVIGGILERVMRAHETGHPELSELFADVRPLRWPDRHLAMLIQALEQSIPRVADDAGIGYGTAAVFDFLIERLAAAEGRKGDYLTPKSIVQVMVGLTDPQPGERIYDPWCRSGEILAAAATHMAENDEAPCAGIVSGHAPSANSWGRARMNLDIHGIAADMGPRPLNALRLSSELRRGYDVILANPPFNMRAWTDGNLSDSSIWPYGMPPDRNANFAWLQFISTSLHRGGRAAVLMPNGASVSEDSRERAIRAAMIEKGAVDCLVALPPQLFSSTGIPVTLWLLRSPGGAPKDLLFIDATSMGQMVNRTHRVLSSADIERIIGAYTTWCSPAEQEFAGEPGFAQAIPVSQIRKQDYIVNPRRYVSGTSLQKGDSLRWMLPALRDRAELLGIRAAEIDAVVEQQLGRITEWRR